MGRAAPGEFAYRKVYRYLEALIDQAAGASPCRLPSLRALSRRLRVSLVTVQSAYNLLEEEGRVQCLPRSGYYVLGAGKQEAVAMPRQPPLPVQPVLERALLAHERRMARQRAASAAPWEALGSARLRNAVAERYTRSSNQYWRADDVQLAPDVLALLETLLAALALHGTTVLVHSPCCWQVLGALARAGMRVLEVPLDSRGNPDLRALASLLRSEPVRMLVMPSCLGTPQGRLFSSYHLQQLGQLLGQHPVWLLENDLDSELCFSGPPHARLRDWIDPRWLLVVGAFEAAVGAEAPYAYVLGHDGALAKAFGERAFRLAPLRLQALAHMLGKGEIETQLAQLRTQLQRRTQSLARALELQFGPRVALEIPQGGRTLWVRFHQPLPWAEVVVALAGSALHALPGTQFSLQGRYQQYLALVWLGDDPDDLQQAVERLAQVLELRCGRPAKGACR
ncbi:aminotransferase class I/II-fold pyridoxal phosphate-dependent enzyme [Pseudomonas sp. CM25]|uniref:aminotransferase class I/II-fold pyridoxal phosphate-dependent enzyme n=1 Tax=Pseudomonas sp. CM25 TaxID=2738448 RepID=UPI00155178B7|nr:aminotransferase class I/II-fold pyridoxal phosphate-dependent enzyme [Pseudomonas sp. CM25]NQD55796.1 aminotransferase class I/II-fold pyridoxal phosphate-dependent enzyme [Pseudomonas sp. CM25]HEN8797825.1 aminotransferase class I/II-fold pyridoxal phosphate-dependent enzyme [Pseudomonas putida]